MGTVVIVNHQSGDAAPRVDVNALTECAEYEVRVPSCDGDVYLPLFDAALELFNLLPRSPLDRLELLEETFPTIDIAKLMGTTQTKNCAKWGGLRCMEYCGLAVFGAAVGFDVLPNQYEDWINGLIEIKPAESRLSSFPDMPWMRELFDGPLRLYRNIYGCTALYWLFPVM